MSSPTLIEAIVAHRFAQTDDIETWKGLGDRVTQQIPLGLGGTAISREVIAQGVYGETEITSDRLEDFLLTSSTRYVLRGGTLIQLPDSNRGKERKASFLRHGIIATRLLFGRADHSEYDTLVDVAGHEAEYDDRP